MAATTGTRQVSRIFGRPGRRRGLTAAALLLAVVLRGDSVLLFTDAAAGPLRHAQFDPAQTYYLYCPSSPAPAAGWPLVLSLHSPRASAVGDFALWRPYAQQEPFVLLAPKFPDPDDDLFDNGEDRQLVQLIQEVSRDCSIDRSKMLVSGFGLGGSAAARLVFAHPQMIHTAMLHSPAAPLPQVSRRVDRSHTMFYIAGASGDSAAAMRMKSFAQTLRRKGYQVELHLVPGKRQSIASRSVVDLVRLVRGMATPIAKPRQSQ